MRFLSLIILSVLLYGCALTNHEAPPASPGLQKADKASKVNPPEGKGAVWDLLSDESLTLQFTNVDTQAHISVVLRPGLNIRPIAPGHWELTGFVQDGKSFTSNNISKKFVMRVKARSFVYAGSVLTRCPRIESKDYKLLKGMNFFDKYPFSRYTVSCEMVVGNDLNKVTASLRNSRKSKSLILDMGF